MAITRPGVQGSAKEGAEEGGGAYKARALAQGRMNGDACAAMLGAPASTARGADGTLGA
jgi:hypothetical protein